MTTCGISGAEKDYRFGIKNQWRRTVWNDVTGLLRSPPREAVVVYLAGKDDLDRSEAIRRGFIPKNLIAVERDVRLAEALRRRGNLVVKGDFFRTLQSWPQHQPVGVIHADLCCGLTAKTISGFLNALLNPALLDAVVVINLQRGREMLDPSVMEWTRKAAKEKGVNEKHRGFALFALWQAAIWNACNWSEDGQAQGDVVSRRWRRVGEIMDAEPPKFREYPSGNLRFDSMIVRNIWGSMFRTATGHAIDGDYRATYKAAVHERCVGRNIAPILAHRTMYADRRLQG